MVDALDGSLAVLAGVWILVAEIGGSAARDALEEDHAGVGTTDDAFDVIAARGGPSTGGSGPQWITACENTQSQRLFSMPLVAQAWLEVAA